MKKGIVPRDDPQFGLGIPIARVDRVTTFKNGEMLKAGSVILTAHLTPGHTPGGSSWTWRSCETGRCLDLVYADSLTPVSTDDFLFTRSKEYPHAIADFERSYTFLYNTPCDILITPHPDFSNLWQRLGKRNRNPNALMDRTACRTLADNSRKLLKARLEMEGRQTR